MANTSKATQKALARPEITFYLLGERVTKPIAGMQKLAWSVVDENIKNLVPTTYAASVAYLAQERLKPKAAQDLRREMCMMNVAAIPSEQDLVLVIPSMKAMIPLYARCSLFLPTTELPPDIFGTPEEPSSQFLLDRRFPNIPHHGRATIILSYFTRTGGELELLTGKENAIKLDYTPSSSAPRISPVENDDER
ncbi:hypothetical protein FIBSPDRAFT_1042467 [Athelia psychrophila]|uniref:Uncharacterized protein n=1 Tax=Athelia psychrophila TaxID=1759441 RepID=A0A166MDR8_9AGAM|nr:hypothetical protein FIBSPDRAFT_1042467 [Fibularhizoctonia sp. CBS 109695]